MYTTNFFEDDNDIFEFVDVDEDKNNNNQNQSERIFELDDPPVVKSGEDLILFCCCGKKGTFTKKNTLIYNNFSDDDNDYNDYNDNMINKSKNKRKREIIGSEKMTFSEIRCHECDLVLTLSSHPVMKWCIDSVSLEKNGNGNFFD